MATAWRRIGDIFFGRATTLGLAVTAVMLGVATFVLLAGGSPLKLKYFYKKYSTKSIKNMDFTDQNYRKNNVHF